MSSSALHPYPYIRLDPYLNPHVYSYPYVFPRRHPHRHPQYSSIWIYHLIELTCNANSFMNRVVGIFEFFFPLVLYVPNILMFDFYR